MFYVEVISFRPLFSNSSAFTSIYYIYLFLFVNLNSLICSERFYFLLTVRALQVLLSLFFIIVTTLVDRILAT